MIIYRLALERIIKYLHLADLFKEDEHRLLLLHKKPKEIYRAQLLLDKTMNLCVSILLSVISLLLCISIPYAVLDSPCEELKRHKFENLFVIAKWLEKYIVMLDRLIIVLSVLLVVIWIILLWDGIKRTKISKSPWLERGKYELPVRKKDLYSARTVTR